MLHHYYGLDKPSWFTDDVFEGFDSDSCEYSPPPFILEFVIGCLKHVNAQRPSHVVGVQHFFSEVSQLRKPTV